MNEKVVRRTFPVKEALTASPIWFNERDSFQFQFQNKSPLEFLWTEPHFFIFYSEISTVLCYGKCSLRVGPGVGTGIVIFERYPAQGLL